MTLADFQRQHSNFPGALDAPLHTVNFYRGARRESIFINSFPPTGSIPYRFVLRRVTQEGAITPPVYTSITVIRSPFSLEAGKPIAVFTFDKSHAPKTITLKEVLDIYNFLDSPYVYSQLLYLAKNRYWFTACFMECLQGCAPCFVGSSLIGIAYTPERAIEIKMLYLKEKHPNCCHSSTQHPTDHASMLASLAQDRVPSTDSGSSFSGPMPGSPSLCMMSLDTYSVLTPRPSRSTLSTIRNYYSSQSVEIVADNPPSHNVVYEVACSTDGANRIESEATNARLG
ncbi:hypothetical protein RhiJN_26835 [Ceratobasidium sp. AG-Ba]|nr:hypothetical protein RhiJN_26835 [Ceratobasidium sp. AG-Ba]